MEQLFQRSLSLFKLHFVLLELLMSLNLFGVKYLKIEEEYVVTVTFVSIKPFFFFSQKVKKEFFCATLFNHRSILSGDLMVLIFCLFSFGAR